MNGENIKQLRYKLDYSQQKFAESLGVSIFTVVRWEKGKFKPSHMAMEKLLKLQRKVDSRGAKA
jgi:DNA-binding transcriptional regulator YiaG